VQAVAFSADGRLLAAAEANSRVRLWDVFGRKELADWVGHAGDVTCVAFAPDGKALASGSTDTTILLWDVRGLRPTPPAAKGTLAELAKLAAELAHKDPAVAYRAAWALAGAADQALPPLQARLRPVPKLDAALVRRLLAQLDDDDRKRRDEASAGLTRLGRPVEAALRRALAAGPSAAARRRLRQILARLAALPTGAEELRDGRAVLVLELIGSAAARELLAKLAGGEPDAALTRDAKAALDRLRRAAKRAP
jgi:hypothetical protein